LPEVYVAVDRPLGWFQLEKGRHTLSFVCVGRDEHSAGYDFGVEDVILEKLPTGAGEFESVKERQLVPVLPEATASQIPGTPIYRGRALAEYVEKLRQSPREERAEVVRAIGCFGEDGLTATSPVAEALADPDPQVRAAAAWALSQMAPKGASAIPDLAKALSDATPRVRALAALALEAIGPAAAQTVPELVRTLNDPVDYVRVSAADALGSMGSAGRRAVQPLAERLLVKNEEVMVLRSVAGALGNIGPGAKEALPALRQTLKQLRVSYAVEAAILKIEGKPVPMWW
jgi:hypothetical protein